jgi:hypothetical protein
MMTLCSVALDREETIERVKALPVVARSVVVCDHPYGSLLPESSCFANSHGKGGNVFAGRKLFNNLADCLSAVTCGVSGAAGMIVHCTSCKPKSLDKEDAAWRGTTPIFSVLQDAWSVRSIQSPQMYIPSPNFTSGEERAELGAKWLTAFLARKTVKSTKPSKLLFAVQKTGCGLLANSTLSPPKYHDVVSNRI